MTLDEILKESPVIPGYGGGQWAMYSMLCCWWTSIPGDLGDTQKPRVTHYDNETGAALGDNSPGLPCCPHCGSVLLQAPLKEFVKSAEENPEHYGKFGLDAFVEAHSRNSKVCHRSWQQYNDDIDRRFNPPMPEAFA